MYAISSCTPWLKNIAKGWAPLYCGYWLCAINTLPLPCIRSEMYWNRHSRPKYTEAWLFSHFISRQRVSFHGHIRWTGLRWVLCRDDWQQRSNEENPCMRLLHGLQPRAVSLPYCAVRSSKLTTSLFVACILIMHAPGRACRSTKLFYRLRSVCWLIVYS